MQYIKEDIEKILIEHKENEGKLLEVELKIEEHQIALDYAGTIHEDTPKEVIESMQLSGQAYDNIHSNTTKTSDKVLNTVINYHKEQYYINEKDRKSIKEEKVRLEKQKEILNKKIVRVKNWLDKIEEEEAFVLKEFYINNGGKNWSKTKREYDKYHNKELTDRQLRTFRDNGIKKILKIVNI